jgi:glycosyltransferase involved in cell wall biosynthesis
MHILFLLTQDLDSPGGLGRYGPLAQHLTRQGHTVELAALHPAYRSRSPRCFTWGGVRVRYVAQMHVKWAGHRKEYFPPGQLLWVTTLATLALTRAALSSRAEVVHIAKAQPMNGLAGRLARGLRGARLYLDYDDFEAATNQFGGRWQRAIVRWWEDRLPRMVRGVTCNTTFLRDRCLRLGVPPERVRVVPNGVDARRFRGVPPAEVEALRARWGLHGVPVALYLGTLSLSNHPILLLLDAFVEVHRRLPAARLLLVGGGQDYDRVAAALRERGLEHVSFMPGAVPPAMVPAVYLAADLLVDPVEDDDIARSRSPLKVLESLACGVPVVTGAVGDRPAMLAADDPAGPAGLLVAPGSAAALAEGLLALLTDPAARARLASAAPAAVERYRWDDLAAHFAGVYAN